MRCTSQTELLVTDNNKKEANKRCQIASFFTSNLVVRVLVTDSLLRGSCVPCNGSTTLGKVSITQDTRPSGVKSKGKILALPLECEPEKVGVSISPSQGRIQTT